MLCCCSAITKCEISIVRLGQSLSVYYLEDHGEYFLGQTLALSRKNSHSTAEDSQFQLPSLRIIGRHSDSSHHLRGTWEDPFKCCSFLLFSNDRLCPVDFSLYGTLGRQGQTVSSSSGTGLDGEDVLGSWQFQCLSPPSTSIRISILFVCSIQSVLFCCLF